MPHYPVRSTNTVRKALTKTRTSYPHSYAHRFRREVGRLRKHYGIEGRDAADLLEQNDNSIGELVDRAALDHLLIMREHARKKTNARGRIAAAVERARLPWYTVHYGLRLLPRSSEPDFRELGEHDPWAGDELVDRFIAEASIALAQDYDRSISDPRYRAQQHENLRRELGLRPTGFANATLQPREAIHLRMVRKLGELEHARITVAAGRPVNSRGKTLTPTEARIELTNGLAKLPTLGPWDRTTDPLKAVAYARAIPTSDIQGLSFTVNLSFVAFHTAANRKRATSSVFQERLRYAFRKELGSVPRFQFCLEKGLGEAAHLHGAVHLAATADNRKRLRKALDRVARDFLPRKNNARSVNIQLLYTPARWAAYALKRALTSKVRTGACSLLGADRETRRIAKQVWEEMREEQRIARQVASTLCPSAPIPFPAH